MYKDILNRVKDGYFYLLEPSDLDIVFHPKTISSSTKDANTKIWELEMKSPTE